MNFRRLEAYRCAIRFVAVAAKLSESLGKGSGEIRSQLRRASISIPLNIAEASGRTGEADQRRHFAIARGSAMECAALNDVCRVLGLPMDQHVDEADALLASLVRMLLKLCR